MGKTLERMLLKQTQYNELLKKESVEHTFHCNNFIKLSKFKSFKSLMSLKYNSMHVYLEKVPLKSVTSSYA